MILRSLKGVASWRRQTASVAPTTRDFLPPLRRWRSGEIDWTCHVRLDDLRTALSLAMWPGQPDWRAAAKGDAVVAIRLAFLTMAQPAPSAWAIDLAASALLLCAAEGNPAARLVLEHFRRRFAASNASYQRAGDSR